MSLFQIEGFSKNKSGNTEKASPKAPVLKFQDYEITPHQGWSNSAQNDLKTLRNILSHSLSHNSVEFLLNDKMWGTYKRGITDASHGFSGRSLDAQIRGGYVRVAAILGIPKNLITDASGDAARMRTLLENRIEAEHAAHDGDWEKLWVGVSQAISHNALSTESRSLTKHVEQSADENNGAIMKTIKNLKTSELRINGVRNPETREIEGGFAARLALVKEKMSQKLIVPQDIADIQSIVSTLQTDIALVRSHVSVKEARRVATLLNDSDGTLKKDTMKAYKGLRAATMRFSKMVTQITSALEPCSKRAARFAHVDNEISEVAKIANVLQETEKFVDMQIDKLSNTDEKGYRGKGRNYRDAAERRKVYNAGEDFGRIMADIKIRKLPELRQKVEDFTTLAVRKAA